MDLVVAVSGGVDSVVLLDQLARNHQGRLTVAHFDHGMRQDSASDARFVAELARSYGLDYRLAREELAGAGEDRARTRRYLFLNQVASQASARLATAHHQDDLVETVALNIQRGTRWRGLACMSDDRIYRPLLKRTKSELMDYATRRRLEWVEDETNSQDIYQRNRLRKRLPSLPTGDQLKVAELRYDQLRLRTEIEREIRRGNFPVENRYFLTMIDGRVARELVYQLVLRQHGVSLLTKQLDYLLLAVKTGRSGSLWQITKQIQMKLTQKNATIERVD